MTRRMLAGILSGGSFTDAHVRFAMKKLARKVKKCGVTFNKLKQGMRVEREHRDVTRGGVEATARIALAHLCERKDYYTRLKKYVEKS